MISGALLNSVYTMLTGAKQDRIPQDPVEDLFYNINRL